MSSLQSGHFGIEQYVGLPAITGCAHSPAEVATSEHDEHATHAHNVELGLVVLNPGVPRFDSLANSISK
jgi:hypothetical protein